MGNAVIFNGPAVKALKNKIKFKNGQGIESGAVDPSVVATDGIIGDQFLRNTGTDLEVFKKLDNGSTTNWEKQDVWSKQDVLDILSEVNNEPNGFPNYSADSTISYVNGTRTFTITPVGTSFRFYSGGKEYNKTIAENIVWPDLEGEHYFYYDETGTLITTQLFDINIIIKHAFVAILYWDATNSEVIYFGNERHGTQMDGATHGYLHLTNGTRFISGSALTVTNTDASGDLDSHAEFDVASGVYADEDITYTNPAQTQWPIFYKEGATGTWRRTALTSFGVSTTGTGRAAWNEFTGATWQLTEVGNNDFVLAHVFATNGIDADTGYIVIMGQAEYATQGDARAGANEEIGNLVTSGLPFAEFVPVASIIYQTSNGYANSVQSRTRTTDTGDDFVNWLGQSISPTTSPSSHGNLSGLQVDDHFAIYKHNYNTVTTVTADTVLTSANLRGGFYNLDASSNSVDLELPELSTLPDGYHLCVKCVDNSFAVTISTFTGDFILPAIAIVTLENGQIIELYKVSGGWNIVNDNYDILVPISRGGSGQTTQQAAIDALTDSASASTDQVLTRDGSGNAVWKEVPEVDNTNYAQNFDFEDGVSGVTGDTNLTVSQETINPLIGTGSLKISKVGTTDTSGQKVQLDNESIDTQFQSKILQVKFYYDNPYDTGDFVVKCYDETSSEYLLGTYDLPSGSGEFTGTWQMGATTVDTRIEVECVTTETTDGDILIDNFYFGEQNSVVYGAVTLDQVEWQGTLVNGTNVSSHGGFYGRQGDLMSATYKLTWSGAGSGGLLEIELPSGLSVDVNKLQDLGNDAVVGTANIVIGGVRTVGSVIYAAAQDSLVVVGEGKDLLDGSDFSGGGDELTLNFKIPIEGWSSNVKLSSTLASTETKAELYNAPAQTLTVGGFRDIDFSSSIVKGDIQYNGGGEIEVLKDGYYNIAYRCLIDYASTLPSSTQTIISFNDAIGTNDRYGADVHKHGQASSYTHAGNVNDVYLAKGTTIKVKINTGTNDVSISSGTGRLNSLSVSYSTKNYQTIAQDEKVVAIYETSSTQSIPNSTTTIVNYDTKVYDTHNAVTIGASWKFIAPKDSFYAIKSQNSGSSAAASSDFLLSNVYVDNVGIRGGIQRAVLGNAVNYTCDTDVYLTKGQELNIRLFQTTSAANSLDGVVSRNWVSIRSV